MPVSAPSAEFAADVARGLRAVPKRIPPKYFYDALGSSLFDAICRLPWYPITRAEQRLLAEHASTITARLRGAATADRVTLIELGCGNGEKLARVGRAVHDASLQAAVHLVDVSASALRKTARRLRRFEGFTIASHRAGYAEGLAVVRDARDASHPAMVLFLGSNIGNFDPPDAAELLAAIRASLLPGDFFLLGADLVKPADTLLLAYDDPLGVTAAFNKNLLVRMNRELGANFDLAHFQHEAKWNPSDRRVEMYLSVLNAHHVDIPASALPLDFGEGDVIWTESSYKYEPLQLSTMLGGAGFAVVDQWVDAEGFALTLAIREADRSAREQPTPASGFGR